jgi:hypothetical protein
MISKDIPILSTLESGQITVTGEFMWGSNYTFAVEVTQGKQTLQGVYKPTKGERPLWDFPRASLAHREVSAYLVSNALGWDFVPPTVYRKDGPAGPGSLQLYVDHDPEYNYFSFSQSELQRLRPVVAFDLVINNADRKGSHVMVDKDNHLWLIDHGVSFHRQDKLRTVIWNFAGEPIPEDLCLDLKSLKSKLDHGTDLHRRLEDHLSGQEIDAIARRTLKLIELMKFPDPHPNRRPYPWPPV